MKLVLKETINYFRYFKKELIMSAIILGFSAITSWLQKGILAR